jgi:hypothetical protein
VWAYQGVVSLPQALVVIVSRCHEVASDAGVQLGIAGPEAVHADHIREVFDAGVAHTLLSQPADDGQRAEKNQGERDEARVKSRELADQSQADDARGHQH